MLLLVALGIISSFAAVLLATEKSENIDRKPPAAPLLNLSGLSLPPEHVPYFLHNNKRFAKECRLDPLCPFKVRYSCTLSAFFFSPFTYFLGVES